MANNSLSKQNNLIEGQSAILGEEVIIFLLDMSGSMHEYINFDALSTEVDRRYTKAGALKNSMKKFIEQRAVAIDNGAKDNIGVILFGGRGKSVRVLHEATNMNYGSLLAHIASLETGGSTPMAEGYELALSMASRFTVGFIRMVIVSDGQPDDKGDVLEKVMGSFNQLGIVTDTIGIGNGKNSYSLDEAFMKEVAERGGGEYTRITDYDSMEKKFLDIEQERAVLLGRGIFMLPEAGATINGDD